MKSIKRISVPLLLAVLVLIPFWDLIWLPTDQVIAGRDIDYMFLQWWRFGLESVRQGELPLWNPYLYSGVPFLANPQPAHFYPPVWLGWVLPATRLVGLLIVLHVWLSGIGMYGWLRSERAEKMGAFFGAVIYAFSGYFVVRIFAGHLGVVMTLAWLPTLLWAYNLALKRNSYAAAVLAGVAVALAFLAGHTASFLYLVLALAAYVLYRAWKSWQETQELTAGLRPLLFGAVMFLTGLGLGAVQLLPTWEFVSLSTRQAGDYAFAANHSWPPGYLVTLFIPNFFGEPGQVGYWGAGVYEELILYAGVLPLVLILALGFGKAARNQLVGFLLLLGGVGLLLALGQFGILHRLAFNFLPVFGSTRAPARAGFLLTFAVAALGGLLLTWLLREPDRAASEIGGWLKGPFPWLVAVVTVLIVLAGFLIFALQRDSNPEVGRLWHIANNSALFLLFFLLATALLWALATGRLSAQQVAALAIGLVLLDLWGFARTMIQPVPVEESAYWRIVAQITAGEKGRVLPWGLGIFEHNKGLAFDLESVFAYDPLELERYNRFTTAVPDPRATAYDLLNARYLVSSNEMEFPDSEEADVPRLVGQRDGVWVYERPTALPAAWLVHQVEVHDEEVILDRLNAPGFDATSVVLLESGPPCDLTEPVRADEVQLYRRGNNRVEVVVSTEAAGVLVLSEVFYPGWRAKLDGEPVPLLQANYVLQGICVPAGQHNVTLSFVPASLRAGAGITLVSLLLVGWAGFTLWRARRQGTVTLSKMT